MAWASLLCFFVVQFQLLNLGSEQRETFRNVDDVGGLKIKRLVALAFDDLLHVLGDVLCFAVRFLADDDDSLQVGFGVIGATGFHDGLK